MHIETLVQADDAQGRLGPLCDHLRDIHQFEVTLCGPRAEVIFPDGSCVLEALPDGLRLTLRVQEARALPDAQAFFTHHLQRFVPKRGAEVRWTSPKGGRETRAASPADQLRTLAATLDQAAQGADLR